MFDRFLLTAMLVIALTGCADFQNQNRHFHGVGNAHCTELKREINTSGHRLNQRMRLYPTEQARLIKEYQTLGCENE